MTRAVEKPDTVSDGLNSAVSYVPLEPPLCSITISYSNVATTVSMFSVTIPVVESIMTSSNYGSSLLALMKNVREQPVAGVEKKLAISSAEYTVS